MGPWSFVYLSDLFHSIKVSKSYLWGKGIILDMAYPYFKCQYWWPFRDRAEVKYVSQCLKGSDLGCVPDHTSVIHYNEKPTWKLTQRVALTHNSVKKQWMWRHLVLKEPRRRSKCVTPKALLYRSDHRVVYHVISAAYRISSPGSSLDWTLYKSY
jgi:hypothetical protein